MRVSECVCVSEEGGREGGGGGRGADTELKTKTPHVNVGNDRKKVGKKRQKMKERGKTEENGGTPKLNGEQRPLGFRNKRVCKGIRSDTEEGVAKGCKARITIPKVLQMVWASSRR